MGDYPREPIVLRGVAAVPHLVSTDSVIYLEDVCDECKGSGKVEGWYGDEKCRSCNNLGVVLNDNGRAIIQLMSFYSKSKDSQVLLAQKF